MRVADAVQCDTEFRTVNGCLPGLRGLFCIRAVHLTGVRVRVGFVNNIGKEWLMSKRGLLILCSAASLCSSAWVYGGDGIQGDLYQYSTGKSSSSGSGMGDTSSGIYSGWATLPGRTGLVNSVSMSSASPDTAAHTASGAPAGTIQVGSVNTNPASDPARDMPRR